MSLIDPYHIERLRAARAFVMRNLDMFATMAALILLAVMDHITRISPP